MSCGGTWAFKNIFSLPVLISMKQKKRKSRYVTRYVQSYYYRFCGDFSEVKTHLNFLQLISPHSFRAPFFIFLPFHFTPFLPLYYPLPITPLHSIINEAYNYEKTCILKTMRAYNCKVGMQHCMFFMYSVIQKKQRGVEIQWETKVLTVNIAALWMGGYFSKLLSSSHGYTSRKKFT